MSSEGGGGGSGGGGGGGGRKLPKVPKMNISRGAAAGAGVAARLALAAGTVGAAVYYSMYNVQGGERAIIFNRLTGIRDEVKGEGTHCESSSGGGERRGGWWKMGGGKVEGWGTGRFACRFV